MSSPGRFITHVSDTARWTALYRATESARPDALFNDSLAERLAGEHGRAIAPFKFAPENGLAYFENLGWRTIEVESLFMGAQRLHRLPLAMRPMAWLPEPDPRHPGRRAWSAAALLAH